MQGSYMAVGTRVGSCGDDAAMEEERPLGRWGGRLLLFLVSSPPPLRARSSQAHLPAAGRQLHAQMQCVDERMFSSGVHAVCWLR